MNILLISGFNLLSLFVISLISAVGMAVLLVEKRDDWPVYLFTRPLKKCLTFVHPKLGDMFDCTVCVSFWTSLLSDFSIFLVTHGTYFLWPLTGFATIGFVWFIIQFLDAIDRNAGNKSD